MTPFKSINITLSMKITLAYVQFVIYSLALQTPSTLE